MLAGSSSEQLQPPVLRKYSIRDELTRMRDLRVGVIG